MSKLASVFNKSASEKSTTDQVSCHQSSDKSVNTYMVSKFFKVDSESSFEAQKFMKDVKQKFSPKEIRQIYEGLNFKKDFKNHKVNYKLDFYSDSSCFLEVETSGSAKASESSVKELGEFMLGEVKLLSEIITQKRS